ncbi:flagellar basal body L-ring protein FlgH [Rickettsiales endosymbiont of Stachyamoeba lipophora]|uniref:flagellar basal body L-ring protein FlgH n=1 Tax=Rickettsiales endosymbiont of Stachyamoeba lipophora TaxID=2486578 RepID=UPI000F652646|nr:flagellar basal body L-ring protein FlgH [Rickettsiales endosymbiont of Stachyamoeba lipophora]AZL15662.1 flagellar basal body L-ring protein FlgH [Rickettsiales endosymbiont of Stachyamoeba lipophora]
MKIKKIFLFICILTIITSCINTAERLKQVGKAPELDAVDAPTNKSTYKKIEWPQDEERHLSEILPPNHNSLWRTGSRTFFRDQFARNIGDIVKVVIEINDKANLDNNTEQSRNGSDNIAAPSLFGFERKYKTFLPDAVDPTNLASISSGNNHSGKGKISRKEALKTQIAAMVTQILPNGNLVLHGAQEIRVNYELREITIDGIARPEDISSDNAISLDQIAEARVSYGGRGKISDVQQPKVGSQILDILSPF